MGRTRALPAVAGVLVVLGLLLARPAAAAGPVPLTWDATIGGQPVSQATASRPVVLGDTDPTRVVVDMRNESDQPVTVRSVRLEGQVLGLTFFSYSTRLDVALAPQESTQRQIDLDLDDLATQAVGLLPAQVRLVGADRRTLAVTSFPVEVRGSFRSVYGGFGLAVFVITLLLLVWLLVLVWRRRLPSNRWARAVRFLAAGLGVGLTLTFFLSATGMLLPSASRWLPTVLVCGAVAFAIGYLLPLGLEEEPAEGRTVVHAGQHA